MLWTHATCITQVMQLGVYGIHFLLRELISLDFYANPLVSILGVMNTPQLTWSWMVGSVSGELQYNGIYSV